MDIYKNIYIKNSLVEIKNEYNELITFYKGGYSNFIVVLGGLVEKIVKHYYYSTTNQLYTDKKNNILTLELKDILSKETALFQSIRDIARLANEKKHSNISGQTFSYDINAEWYLFETVNSLIDYLRDYASPLLFDVEIYFYISDFSNGLGKFEERVEIESPLEITFTNIVLEKIEINLEKQFAISSNYFYTNKIIIFEKPTIKVYKEAAIYKSMINLLMRHWYGNTFLNSF